MCQQDLPEYPRRSRELLQPHIQFCYSIRIGKPGDEVKSWTSCISGRASSNHAQVPLSGVECENAKVAFQSVADGASLDIAGVRSALRRYATVFISGYLIIMIFECVRFSRSLMSVTL